MHAQRCNFSDAIKILFRRLYRYMTEKGTKTFVDQLQTIIEGLNSRKLRSLKGLAPNRVSPENQASIAEHMRQRAAAVPTRRPGFVAGQTVLVPRPKGAFSKGYRGVFAPEPMIIKEIVTSRGPIPMYKLEDQLQNPVLSLYYESQLSAFEPENA